MKKELNKKSTTQGDGLYDSIFTNPETVKELEQIERAVELVYCRTSYKSYLFSSNRRIERMTITDSLLQTVSDIQYLQKSVLGTATIIFSRGRKVGLLSCAHIFNKPDTLVTYHAENEEQSNRFVASISIKQAQRIFATAKSKIGDLEVVLSDIENDIAILANRNPLSRPLFWSKSMNYPFGRAKDLKWGSFVFILGYPNGHKVLTHALVSSPDRDKKGSFTVDSFFNTGLSGGIVIAIRDGAPNFEIVGMVHSAAGEREVSLMPDKTKSLTEGQVYEDDPIVHYRSNIKQGITFAVSSEAIIELLKENKELLLKKGLNLSHVINEAEKVTSPK